MKNLWLMLVVMLIFGISAAYATEIPTNVSIDNDPYISAISLTDVDGGSLQVLADDSRVFNCSGTAVDLDGFSDISSINATIYGPGSSLGAADISGRHYTNSSCLLYAGSANTTEFDCSYYVHHNAEPGTWTCKATVIDTVAVESTNQTTNTVDIFKSIAVPLQTIAFGSYAHSQDSGATDHNITVNNTGNVKFNVTLDAYSLTGAPSDANAMTCTVGDLPVSSIVFDTTPGVTALSKTPLADSPTLIPANVSFTAYGSTAFVPYSFYLGIVIPASGQGGVCNGFLDVTAT